MKKWYAVATMVAAGALAAACSDSPTAVKELAKSPGAVSATQVNGADFTTTNPAADRPGGVDGGSPTLCLNGQDRQAGTINCNLYTSKNYVWLNGGPVAAQMGGAGDYFFDVLVPSGQGGNDNPNDGTLKNLSDFTPNPTTHTGAGDAWTNRVFTLDASGAISSYSGTHTFANGKIRLMGYDNTTNPGGVYILAICRVPSTIASVNPPGVAPSDCKYDAFKVRAAPPPEVQALTASISITPTATNAIGEQHVFTVNATVNGGTTPYYINITPDVQPAPGTYSSNCPSDPANPLVSSLHAFSCTITINSNVAGVFTANAQIDVVDSGDPQQQASDNTGALGGSGPAIKTYVSADLSWLKNDGAGHALAGATFKIERIADRFGVAISPSNPIITGITDCVASPCLGTDKDPDAGQFQVFGLQLGTWRITETAAPANYDLANPVYQDVVINDLASPHGSAALPFVDPLRWVGETATVLGYPWAATNNAPANWFMYAPWVTQDGYTGISAAGPPAGTWLIAGQHYQAGRVTGTRGGTVNSTSITITLGTNFRFSALGNNVKIQPLSTCSALSLNYIQPGQFSVKRTVSQSATSITVTGLSNQPCYGVHVDVQRDQISLP